MTYSLIVAMDHNHVIGYNQAMPWHLPNDLKYFKSVTSNAAIVMGRKTFDSIGKPLPNRHNIILTRQHGYEQEGCTVIHDWDALTDVTSSDEDVFIIGGATLFEHALTFVDYLYITLIDGDFEGDTFFPSIDWSKWSLIKQEKGNVDDKNRHPHTFNVYKRQ
ncbi:dihydrofolate reductase [Alkalibacillus flavidus]|uniref:Dihydrofolate reductase n=1 Tax=Alkalibacillus flavidus TaxID=546021 RepID=A0ABV2KUA9_9BACI